MSRLSRVLSVSALLAAAVTAQRVAPPIIVMPAPPQDQPAQQPPAAAPPAPAPQTPGAAPGAVAPGANPPAAAPSPRLADSGGFMLNNVSLVELIDILAKRMKINYILDPRVKGSVSIFTYGDVKSMDLMPLMQTILRVNGATMVKVGDIYRIVPLNAVAPLPMTPMVNADPKTLPNDEQMILNMVFLKYATVGEMVKLIQPFLGEGATVSAYEPANLILLLDNSRSMRRTMELLAMFDSDTFAGQRVRLFDVSNGRPTDLVKELESVFKAYAFSEKSAGVKFLPVDRINIIIGVAPNPGIFAEVENWLKKLDIPVKITAGAVNNYVYRLKYGRSETVAMAIMALYGGGGMGYGGMGYGGMGMGGGYGGMGMGGGYGGMGMGGGYGGLGMGGGYGGMGMGGGYGGMGMGGGYGGLGMGGGGLGMGGGYGGQQQGLGVGGNAPMFSGQGAANAYAATTGGQMPATGDFTGSFLGAGGYGNPNIRIPHVVPNPFDNTLLVQGTPQEWEQISHLLQQLDVPPRQVLIDAKIYEVDLTGELSAGVSAYLQKRTNGAATTPGAPSRILSAASSAAGLSLTAGALVLRSHEILALLTATDTTTKTKVIASPSIIATDSVPASFNVGQEVPTLTSQAVSGAQQSGSSLFTNTIANRSSGVTLNILARVNSSGIVTLVINQDVSSPQAPQAGGIQSPSFQRRSVQTQVTVSDGDTVAIAGIITESQLHSSAGLPGLHRLPFIGAMFGSKSSSNARTELVIILTPRVIYDTNQIAEASDEIKTKFRKLSRDIRQE